MKQNDRRAVLITECPYSGILRAILEHSKLLKKLGFELYFVVPKTPRDRYGEKLNQNILLLEKFGKVLKTPLGRKYRKIWKDKQSLGQMLTDFKDSIIFSYTGYAGKICRLLFREKKISTLYHVPQCIDIIRKPLWQRPVEFFFEHFLSSYATGYVACSRSESTILSKKFSVNPNGIVLVPNFIVTEKKRNREANKKDLLFVILGRVTKDKGIKSILIAADKLGILHKFTIIGDGNQLTFLRQKYPQATFTGHLDNEKVFSLLSKARFIVSNSIIEGLPFSIIEAMHLGVVPIVSDIPAHHDIVTNPKGGFFFKNQAELERVLSEASAMQLNDYAVYSKNVVKNICSLSVASQNVFINHFKNMNQEAKKIYLGVYGVYQQDDSVLVIKKARGPYKGKLDLPGGGLNFDETLDQCLDREVLEETNAQVLKKVLIGINEYQCQYTKEDGTLKDFHHLGIYYKVDLLIKNLKTTADGEDSNGAIFVPLAALDENNTSPIALPMIQGLKSPGFEYGQRPATIKVAAIIFNQEGKMLLLKERYEKDGELGWNIVKGTYDQTAETIEGCVKREIKEEAGLTVKHLNLKMICHYGKSENPRIMFVFFVNEFSGEITLPTKEEQGARGEEIVATQWFLLKDLQNITEKEFVTPYIYRLLKNLDSISEPGVIILKI